MVLQIRNNVNFYHPPPPPPKIERKKERNNVEASPKVVLLIEKAIYEFECLKFGIYKVWILNCWVFFYPLKNLKGSLKLF